MDTPDESDPDASLTTHAMSTVADAPISRACAICIGCTTISFITIGGGVLLFALKCAC